MHEFTTAGFRWSKVTKQSSLTGAPPFIHVFTIHRFFFIQHIFHIFILMNSSLGHKSSSFPAAGQQTVTAIVESAPKQVYSLICLLIPEFINELCTQ